MAVLIEVYSHHICLPDIEPGLIPALRVFVQRLTSYTVRKNYTGEVKSEIDRVYAAKGKDWSYLRLHRNCLPMFLRYMESLGGLGQYTLKYIDLDLGARANLPVVTAKQPREIQPEIIQYICAEGSTKTVPIQTGKGKTLCSLLAISQIGRRTGILIKPMYVQRWCGDIDSKNDDPILGLRAGKDYYVVSGSKNLAGLIQMARQGTLTADLIIFSNKTMALYFEAYEQNDQTLMELYDCPPWELFQLLQIGVLIRDEVHQDFHFNFKSDLYLHVAKTINLSATLESDNQQTEKMYELMLPKLGRAYAGQYDKYIDVTALFYGLKENSRIRWTYPRQSMYSHIAFEYSLIKDKKSLASWLSFMRAFVLEKFLPLKQDGDRLLIFSASVEMCTTLADHLQASFENLTVFRYVADDEYEGILDADIIVSTVLSAGTAVDIPGLIVTNMTCALGTKQGNLQCLGRLRKPRNYPEKIPHFYYMSCADIPKHMEFHHRKVETFKGKVLSHAEVYVDLKV